MGDHLVDSRLQIIITKTYKGKNRNQQKLRLGTIMLESP